MQILIARGREAATKMAMIFWENFTQRRQDISKVEIEDLIRTLMLINSRPRKCLNYTTSFEKFLYEIKF